MNLGSDGGGHRSHHAAIGQQPPLMLNGLEEAGEGAARSDGHIQGTPAKYMRCPRIKVGSHNSCWDGQVLYSARAEPLPYKLADQVLFFGLPIRVLKADEIPHAHAAAQFAKLTRGDAVGKGSTEQGPDAGADDGGNWDLLLFENIENAQMGESPGEAATQSHDDSGSFSMGPNSAQANCRAVWTLCLWFRPTERCHAASLAGQYGSGNHTDELDFRYPGTWYEGQESCAATGNSTSLLCD